MRIVCKDNNELEKVLTKGKVYNVINEYEVMYVIINDLGEKTWYQKENFVKKEKCIICQKPVEGDYDFTKGDIYELKILDHLLGYVSIADNYGKFMYGGIRGLSRHFKLFEEVEI